MSRPRVMILRTAGTNCDEETAHAWQLAGADPRRVHVRELIDRPATLRDYGILTIPGGFSYGDDIAAGKILAVQIVRHLADAVRGFVEAGRLVLGICNGFQVLVRAGLLPGEVDRDEHGQQSTVVRATQAQRVTLAGNDSARFEDRWVHVRTASKASAFLPADRILAMPVAHGEGKLVAADDTVRRGLAEKGHVALTYCDDEGRAGAYPVNPNGSEMDVAGLVDATGQILGLMPHPERHVDPTQHPQWTRRRGAPADGLAVFESAARWMTS